jgi:hypothetical protein
MFRRDADLPNPNVICGVGSCQCSVIGWAIVNDERRSACRTHLDPSLGANEDPRHRLDSDGVPIERSVPGGFAKASQDDL